MKIFNKSIPLIVLIGMLLFLTLNTSLAQKATSKKPGINNTNLEGNKPDEDHDLNQSEKSQEGNQVNKRLLNFFEKEYHIANYRWYK